MLIGVGVQNQTTQAVEKLQVCCKGINSAVYSLVSMVTTCATLLGNAWIWFDLLCWVCQSMGHSWIGQCGE